MKNFKRILSLLLTAILLLSVMAPAASAAEKDIPIIYLEGYGGNLYKDDKNPTDENQIYPTGADVGGIISEALMPCLEELAIGYITKDYSKYSDELYNALAPVYEDILLDKNGEASDGSGDGDDMLLKPFIIKNYSGVYKAYRFKYDWRLSPMAHADELMLFIERVKAATKSDKVALVGRCLGGNIISAYLAKYENHAASNIESVVLISTSTIGIKFLSGIFSGNIVINEDGLDRFADYWLKNKGIMEDAEMANLISAFVSFMSEAKLLGIGTDTLQSIVDDVKDDCVSKLALACYANFPSYWAMVTPEKYIEARDYIFKGIEDEYAGLIAKTDDYYYNCQLKIEETMKNLKAKGVNFCILSKYNLPSFPLYEESNESGDLFTGVYETSLGATAADINKVLPDSYISSLEDTKYLSPDHKVDASTCLFPDTTWFAKNCQHAEFTTYYDVLSLKFIRSKGAMTVFTDEAFPQYLMHIDDVNYSVVEGLDEPTPQPGSNENRFLAFIRFFTALFNFLGRVFRGEVSFGG
ncbi:MAG: alpha/beta fold hydrolase [Clostridia bacterium]|nr:alpha/beta fold hydrolase [Clostridia bacterium]